MHNSFLQRRGTATLVTLLHFISFFFFFFFFLLKISYFSSRGSLFYYFKVQYKASNPESKPQTLQGHQWHQALQPPLFFRPLLEAVAHFLQWKASWQCGTGGFTRRGKKGNQEGAYLTNHWDSGDGA